MISFNWAYWETLEDLNSKVPFGPAGTTDDNWEEFQRADLARQIVQEFFKAYRTGEITLERALYYAQESERTLPESFGLGEIIKRERQQSVTSPNPKKISQNRRVRTLPKRLIALIVGSVTVDRAVHGLPVTREAREKTRSAFDSTAAVFESCGLKVTSVQIEKWYFQAKKMSKSDFDLMADDIRAGQAILQS